MSFEMKYNKNGDPISQPMPQQEVAQPEAAQLEQQLEVLQSTEPQEEVEQPVDAAHTVEEVKELVEEKKTSSRSPQESWKILRQKAEQAERERDEALRIAQEMQEKLLGKKNVAAESDEEELSIDDDALLEGKHLKKVTQYVKKLEHELKQQQQQAALMAVEVKLKAQYPDFDKVVSTENLQSLRAVYPEIAATINASPDLYNKAVSAYTMLKKLGIAQDESYVEQKVLAQRNAVKPKPSVSIAPQQGESPLSRANAFANGLTEDLKKQLLKEMMEARR